MDMQLAPSHGVVFFFFFEIGETHWFVWCAKKANVITLLYYSFQRSLNMLFEWPITID